MKRTIISFALVILLAIPVLVLAAGAPTQAPTLDVMKALDLITDWLFALLLIVAVIFLIIAGFFFITAQGDPEKVAKARNMVLWSLVGVLVGFAAKGLVMLIKTMVDSAGGGAGI